jgi:hypothetical protein
VVTEIKTAGSSINKSGDPKKDQKKINRAQHREINHGQNTEHKELYVNTQPVQKAEELSDKFGTNVVGDFGEDEDFKYVDKVYNPIASTEPYEAEMVAVDDDTKEALASFMARSNGESDFPTYSTSQEEIDKFQEENKSAEEIRREADEYARAYEERQNNKLGVRIVNALFGK